MGFANFGFERKAQTPAGGECAQAWQQRFLSPAEMREDSVDDPIQLIRRLSWSDARALSQAPGQICLFHRLHTSSRYTAVLACKASIKAYFRFIS
jgi:hypothetical protein